MKITIDKNVVEFVPENNEETSSLTALWRVMVDCLRDNKKLEPIGEYVPTKENKASFVLEGIKGGKTEYDHDHKAAADATYICAVCNKYMNVKAGDDLPLCCGRVMESVD